MGDSPGTPMDVDCNSDTVTGEQAIQAASDKRQLGNQHFQKKEFETALSLYSEALELLRLGHGDRRDASKIMTNRATCRFMLGDFRNAVEDCNSALLLDKHNAKTYHRKALALAERGYYDLAMRCYQEGLDALAALNGAAAQENIPATPPNHPTSAQSPPREQPETTKSSSATTSESDLDATLQAGLKLLRQQLAIFKQKTSKLSAQDKIDKYVTSNKTILGCPVKLSASMFDIDTMLGEGNYSNVYRATFNSTGELFAIKVVEKEKADRMSRRHPNIHNEVKMERNILYRLQEEDPHPNVVRLYHTFQDNSKLYFVMEHSNGGELWSRMRLGNSVERMVALSENEAVFFSAQLVNALAYLARNGVVHRDIKPENMMLFFNEQTSEKRIVFLKLIDFGTAKDLRDTSLNGPNFVGTPEYMSPEVIRSEDSDTPSDLWSFGCTVFQMLSGTIPFKGGSPYLSFLKAQAREFEMPPYFSDTAKDLINKLLQLKPADRLGAYEPNYQSIRDHPFFHGIDFEQLLNRPILPVGSLFERCLSTIGETLIEVSTTSSSSKRSQLPEWSRSLGAMSEDKFPKGSRTRAAIMGYLAQRGVLGKPRVFPVFFESSTQARFQRAIGRQYVGYTQQEEGAYAKPFIIVQLGSWEISSSDALDRTIRKLSALEPRPRLVVFTGGIGSCEMNTSEWEAQVNAFQTKMDKLHVSIPVVCASVGANLRSTYHSYFGDDYFSLFVGGALVIVTNSELLRREYEEYQSDSEKHESATGDKSSIDKPHISWLERQLLLGKVCARHVLLVSQHRWFETSHSEESSSASDVLPKQLRQHFFPRMLDANAHMIMCAGPTAKRVSVPPQNDLQQKMWHAPIPQIETETLRVLRVFSADIVSDTYLLDELPTWLSMKDENDPDSDQENNSETDDSISSDSDSE